MVNEFNPFDPPNGNTDLENVDKALAELEDVYNRIAGKIDKASRTAVNTIGRISTKVDNAIATAPLELESIVNKIRNDQLLQTNQFIDTGEPTTGGKNELPCCDDVSNPKPENPNGGGNGPTGGDPTGGGNGGGGGNGKPRPNPDCPEVPEGIPCPQPDPNIVGNVFVQDAVGNQISIKEEFAPAFQEQVQAEALTLCPPLDVCRDRSKTHPEVQEKCCPQHGEPNCRICEGEPGEPPGDCNPCPMWVVWVDEEGCTGLIITDEEQPAEPHTKRLSTHATKAEAEQALSDWIETCTDFTPNDLDLGKIPSFLACEEDTIRNLGGLLNMNPKQIAKGIKLALENFAHMKCDDYKPNKIIIDPFQRLLYHARGFLVCNAPDAIEQILIAMSEFFKDSEFNAVVPLFLSIAGGLLERWAGDGITPLQQPFQNAANYALPTLFPDASSAANAWIKNEATLKDAETWARTWGQCPEQWQKVARAGQSLPTVDELINMRLRGIITKEQYDQLHRRLGFIDNRFADMHFALGTWLPGPTDIVRFMVRDAFDEELVTKFKLDQDFTTGDVKYTGVAKNLANQQGVSDDIMRLFWRSHWQLPAVNQAIDLFHRFHYDDTPDDLKVTEETLLQIYRAQDIPDEFARRFIAASFVVPTRVDAARMLKLGTISEEEHIRILQEQGYSRERAEQLTDFRNKEKIRGLPNERPIKQYAQGLISKEQANEEAIALGYDALDVAAELNRQDRVMQGKTRLSCTKSLKRRYMQGEFTKEEAQDELQQLGWEPFRAEQLADKWECERVARPKLAGIKIIRDLVEHFIIDAQEATQRLVNFGYRKEDAILAAASIVAKVQTSTYKEMLQLRNEIVKELQAELKRKLQQLKRRRTKRQKKDDREERERKASDARNNKLTTAVGKHNAKFGSEFDAVYGKADNLRSLLSLEFGLSATAANNAVVQSINQSVKQEIEDFEPLAREIAEQQSSQ